MVLKIAINICGHLRGYKNIPYIKNFFSSYDLEYINKKINTNYSDIKVDYFLYTIKEININHNHKNYIKNVYPEKYREYTLDDFNFWIDKFKSNINFKNIEVVSPVKFLELKEELYSSFLSKTKPEIPNLSLNNISMFLKREQSIENINNDYDIIFNIRPDLIFKYELNTNTNDFNEIIIQIINESNLNAVYVPLLNCEAMNNVISNDFYHYGLSKNIKLFFKDMIKNNLVLYDEYLNTDREKYPLTYRILENYVLPHFGELKQMINYKLAHVKVRRSSYISTDLEMLDTPFDLNINQYETVYGHHCNKL